MKHKLLWICMTFALMLSCFQMPVFAEGEEENTETDVNEVYEEENDAPVSESGEVVKEDKAAGTDEDAEPYMEIRLSYDKGNIDTYYTGETMIGYLTIESHSYDENLTNFDVKVRIPQEYVQQGFFKIYPQSTESQTKVNISNAEKDGDDFVITLHFDEFDVTSAYLSRIDLRFQSNIVPETYELPVNASIIYEENRTAAAEPIYFYPKYYKYRFRKFLNNNAEDNNALDNRDVAVGLDETDGEAKASRGSQVIYAFKIDRVNENNLQNNWSYYRDIESLTLSDILPEGTRLAEGKNTGWTEETNENGRTVVSKVFTGDSTNSILDQVNAERLILDVSGYPLEKKDGVNFYSGSIMNSASFVAVPSNRAEGESLRTGEDELISVLTTQANAAGSVQKYVYPGDMYDSKVSRSKEVEWRLYVGNDGSANLDHIVIQDLPKEGENRSGLDERLRFTRITSINNETVLSDSLQNVLDYVKVYYLDGTTEDVPVTALTFDGSGDFELVFDETKTVIGFEVYLKKDYVMTRGERIRMKAFTVFRNPDEDHYDAENDENNRYFNKFCMQSHFAGTTYWFWNDASFKILNGAETLEITKSTYNNTTTENSMPGDRYRYQFTLKGSLLEEEDKNIRVVDLLPEGIHFTGRITLNPQLVDKTETVENYKNTGRSAVIFYINLEELEKLWTEHIYNTAYCTFEVQIDEDAVPATLINDIYVIGDKLRDYDGPKGVQDIYDFDEDGNTEDFIAHAESTAYVVGGNSIFAAKYVEQTGQNNRTRTGFLGTAGEAFDYTLWIQNEDSDKTDLVIYDVLPAVGDQNIFLNGKRNSEFSVKLREEIPAIEGYTIYYTTSERVYTESMEALVNESSIWSETVESLDSVTAFKVVADNGVRFANHSIFEVKVPVKLPEKLTKAQIETILEKMEEDPEADYLQANNSFGYSVNTFTSPKQSNAVYLQIQIEEQETEIVLEGTKELKGREMEAGEFRFVVKDGEEEIASGTNNADNKITFSEISYSLLNGDVGTHTYTVVEESGDAGGVTYDTSSLEVKVEVFIGEDGILQAKAVYPESGLQFTNIYEAEPVTVSLSASKKLDGRALNNGEFVFVVKENGEEIARAVNDENGQVVFDEMEFALEDVGTHYLTVCEIAGDKGGVDYSRESYVVTVIITDNGDGTLEKEVILPDGEMVFHNAYKAADTSIVFAAEKNLIGAQLEKNQFTFVLKEEDGTVLETVKNDENGIVRFSAINYSEVGEYSYTISEEDTHLSGVTYDKTVYRVKVTVTDDGEGKLVTGVETSGNLVFINRFTAEPDPTPTPIVNKPVSSSRPAPPVPNTAVGNDK